MFSYWTKQGICWARNSRVHDIDDTAMGFRLLRLHGYEVSQDVFRNFENNGEFFCFAGQSNQAVTGMFNLFRASQLMFPGEKVLEDAKKFSSEFLREKQVAKQLLDKWIITKDLPGEVGYALDFPWYASLPRVETSFYLEQYGGQDDVWIGKTLYRWYAESKLGEFGMSERSLLLSYYLAASSLFEPELSNLRFAWAKTAALVETIRSYFGSHEKYSIDQRKAFVHVFKNNFENLDYVNFQRYKEDHELLRTLLGTLKQLILDTLLTHGIDIHHHLRHAWETWLLTWEDEGDVDKGEAELLERTINVCAGRWASEKLLSHPHYQRLSNITNRLCHQLRVFQYNKVNNELDADSFTTMEIESNMQEVVQLVLCDSSDDSTLDREFKQTFLVIAKTFYYTAYRNPGIINHHINKVLFQRDPT